MKGFKYHVKLLCILYFTSLLLAGCSIESDRTRFARYRTTDDVLHSATEIIRATLDDPRTLKEYDSLLELEAAFLDIRFGAASDYKAWQDYRLEYEANEIPSACWNVWGLNNAPQRRL